MTPQTKNNSKNKKNSTFKRGGSRIAPPCPRLSLQTHASNRVKIIIYHIYSILTDSLLLARFWQSSERDIRLFALSNEAICYNSNNIEILPIICFWGHA